MKTPLISIIIPVYNAETYLEKCLSSLINQTSSNFEIICVNDGSTDNSLKILQKFADVNQRILIFSQTNSGPASARNIGLSKAVGKYLWFIDADDWCEKNACEILEKIITTTHPEVIAFASNLYDNNAGRQIPEKYRRLASLPDTFENRCFSFEEGKDFLAFMPTEAWNKCFEKSFVDKYKMKFNQTLWGMDDGYFTQEAFFHASKIYYTKDILYVYRIFSANSIVTQLTNPSLKNYRNTINYARETDKLIAKLKIEPQYSINFFIRNLNRLGYYFSRCHGCIKYLFYRDFAKYLNRLDTKFKTEEILSKSDCYSLIKKIQKYSYFRFYIKSKKIKLFAVTKQNNHKKVSILGIPVVRKKYRVTKINGFENKKQKITYFLGIRVRIEQWSELNTFNLVNDIIYKVQRSLNIANLHQKTFSPYKNCHQGKEVVLVACGPTAIQYQPIQNAVHIGCNRAFLMKNISFDFLFALDKIGIELFYPEFAAYQGNNCQKFIGDLRGGKDFQIPESYTLKINAKRYKTTNGTTPDRFPLDIESEPLGAFHTVSLQAMQFILYTNPAKIYLVGLDCSGGGKHFGGAEHDVSTRGENIDILEKQQISEWKALKAFAELHYPETEIISINPVGLKGLFKDVYTTKETN